MRLEQFIKEIKKLKDVKINYEIDDDIFKGYIQGIINNMEKKQPTNKEILISILSRLENIEKDIFELKKDVSQLKNEAINHGWNIK